MIFCYKQNKYIHREGVENCYMAIEHEKTNIPNGAYYVRFVRKGYAYVEMGDRIIKIKDNIGVEHYAYVKQNTNGEYELSLTPFIEIESTPKKKSNRKKK